MCADMPHKFQESLQATEDMYSWFSGSCMYVKCMNIFFKTTSKFGSQSKRVIYWESFCFINFSNSMISMKLNFQKIYLIVIIGKLLSIAVLSKKPTQPSHAMLIARKAENIYI